MNIYVKCDYYVTNMDYANAQCWCTNCPFINSTAAHIFSCNVKGTVILDWISYITIGKIFRKD